MTKNDRSYYLYTISNILILYNFNFNFNDMTKTYQELMSLQTFEERFEYCNLNGKPSDLTFNGHRLLNQMLYRSPQWKSIRQKVILRDNGCDLGIADRPIFHNILIHHLNPITIEQVTNHDPAVFDLNNLITVSLQTHNAIHYGALERLTPTSPIERKPNDQIPWK